MERVFAHLVLLRCIRSNTETDDDASFLRKHTVKPFHVLPVSRHVPSIVPMERTEGRGPGVSGDTAIATAIITLQAQE